MLYAEDGGFDNVLALFQYLSLLPAENRTFSFASFHSKIVLIKLAVVSVYIVL